MTRRAHMSIRCRCPLWEPCRCGLEWPVQMGDRLYDHHGWQPQQEQT